MNHKIGQHNKLDKHISNAAKAQLARSQRFFQLEQREVLEFDGVES